MTTMDNRWRWLGLVVCAFGLVLSGCNSDDDDDEGGNGLNGGGGAGNDSNGTGGAGNDSNESATFECTGTSEPAVACCDFGDSMVAICVRCVGLSEAACVDVVTDALDSESMGQGCAGADQLRDSDVFYDECLPAMESVSCDDFLGGNLPASCQDQILYQM